MRVPPRCQVKFAMTAITNTLSKPDAIQARTRKSPKCWFTCWVHIHAFSIAKTQGCVTCITMQKCFNQFTSASWFWRCACHVLGRSDVMTSIEYYDTYDGIFNPSVSTNANSIILFFLIIIEVQRCFRITICSNHSAHFLSTQLYP